MDANDHKVFVHICSLKCIISYEDALGVYNSSSAYVRILKYEFSRIDELKNFEHTKLPCRAKREYRHQKIWRYQQTLR